MALKVSSALTMPITARLSSTKGTPLNSHETSLTLIYSALVFTFVAAPSVTTVHWKEHKNQYAYKWQKTKEPLMDLFEGELLK